MSTFELKILNFNKINFGATPWMKKLFMFTHNWHRIGPNFVILSLSLSVYKIPTGQHFWTRPADRRVPWNQLLHSVCYAKFSYFPPYDFYDFPYIAYYAGRETLDY